MRLLLTGDWHIGIRGDSELYHSIFKKWVIEFLIPTLINENVEVLCILGDFYDNRNAVNTKSDNLGIWAIEYILSKTKGKIYMIVGNHDTYLRSSREINSLKKFEQYDRVIVINSTLKLNFGSRDIVFVPWVLEEEIENLSKIKGDILLGHFPLTGYEMTRGIKETKGFSLESFKKNFLKVFSGHFHLRNDIYVGNPFQMSWADTEDDKGITIFDTETLNVKFIQNIISPVYKKIYLSQIKNKIISLDIITGNFIKIFIDDKYTDKMIEKLQEVIISKKPLSFSIDGFGEDDIITDVEVKDLTNPIESLIIWLDKIEVKSGIERSVLLSKMNELYKGEV
jgi:DNA repair exonuclease SbcCD nuclease subunit